MTDARRSAPVPSSNRVVVYGKFKERQIGLERP